MFNILENVDNAYSVANWIEFLVVEITKSARLKRVVGCSLGKPKLFQFRLL